MWYRHPAKECGRRHSRMRCTIMHDQDGHATLEKLSIINKKDKAMIVDNLQNADFYTGLGEKFQKAFQYLQQTDLAALANGRHAIDGDDIFIIIQEYQTKPTGMWEAHQKYIDLQYVISGREKMGYANIDTLRIAEAYSADNDCVILEGEGSFVIVPAGAFAIFAPHDAHIPGLLVEAPAPVKKAVVKIKI
jgi:biofilm protein TabA